MKILSLLLLSFTSIYGQSINCKEILKKQPKFVTESTQPFKIRIAEDIKILKHCGNFTDADTLFFPILAVEMVRSINQNKDFTYENIILMLQAVKNDSQYKNLLLAAEQEKLTPKTIEKTYDFKPLISYEKSLYEAKMANKNLLLFF